MGGSATPADPPWSEVVGPRGRFQIVTLTGLIVWLYWDQLVRMATLWSVELDWSHGFLILPFCVYCLHTRRASLARITPRASWWGLPLLVFSVVAYIYCIRAKIGYPQAVSMLVVISAVVLLMGGWGLLRLTLFPIWFLLLAIPPSDRIYRALTQQLQQLAAWIAAQVLGRLPDLAIERNGFSLTAVSRLTGDTLATFTVAGACSGMRSLMAFMAIGLAMAYLTPRPAWQRLVMAIVVFPVALLCNVARVVVTGMLLIHQHRDEAKGTSHMLLGLATFGLGIAIYSGILFVFDHLYVETTQRAAGDDPPTPPLPKGGLELTRPVSKGGDGGADATEDSAA